MKLYIKNKLISWGGDSFVTNEAGENVYAVKGNVFSFTRKKKIKDMDGNVLYTVRNKLFNFFFAKAYIYDAEGRRIAKVTHDGLLGFKLVGFEDDVRLSRSFGLSKDILKNGEVIGKMSYQITVVRDAFELEINDKEDVPFFVALVIAIDNMRDKDRSDR